METLMRGEQKGRRTVLQNYYRFIINDTEISILFIINILIIIEQLRKVNAHK